MKIIKTVAMLILLNSCNGQNKNNEKIDKMENNKISEYNIFKEGEMNTNYSDFINKNNKKIESEIKKFGYKEPSRDIFIDKIKYFYNWDVSNYTNVVVLQNSLQPEIVVQDKKLIFVEGEENEIDGEVLWNYNEFIFNNKKNALSWLKLRRPDLLVELVKIYGFDKDNEVLKFVFQKIDFKNKIAVKDYIFNKNNSKKLILRESLIKKIRQLQYDDKKIEGFSEVVQGDFYYVLSDVIRMIDKDPNDYQDSNYCIAYLMNELALSGIVGDLESRFNKNPKFIKILKDNDYYGLEKLKEYATIIYEPEISSDEVQIIYKINDPDGFTNLRKDKNTSSSILEKVKSGEIVEVIEQLGDWYLIRTRIGNEGYVYKTKIKVE